MELIPAREHKQQVYDGIDGRVIDTEVVACRVGAILEKYDSFVRKKV